MAGILGYYQDLYKQYKKSAICLDIETEYSNGPISVIGLFRPKDGEVDYISLVSGINLTEDNLVNALKGVQLLITYNGNSMDIPRIRKYFPRALPKNVKMLDLYILAKELKIDTNLKVLENTLGVVRPDIIAQKRHVATRYWKRWVEKKDKKAFDKLIEYNRQDTINLYPLAEMLIGMIPEKKVLDNKNNRIELKKSITVSERYKRIR